LHCSFYCSVAPCALPSFPTRRSSDLPSQVRSASSRAQRAKEQQRKSERGHMRDEVAVAERATRRTAFGEDFEIESIRLQQRCRRDRKSTRLNSSHVKISYAVFCLKKK